MIKCVIYLFLIAEFFFQLFLWKHLTILLLPTEFFTTVFYMKCPNLSLFSLIVFFLQSLFLLLVRMSGDFFFIQSYCLNQMKEWLKYLSLFLVTGSFSNGSFQKIQNPQDVQCYPMQRNITVTLTNEQVCQQSFPNCVDYFTSALFPSCQQAGFNS